MQDKQDVRATIANTSDGQGLIKMWCLAEYTGVKHRRPRQTGTSSSSTSFQRLTVGSPGRDEGRTHQGESSACKDSETSKSTARPGSARPQGSEGGGGMTRAQSRSGVDCRGGGDRCPGHVPALSTPARQTLSVLILPHKPLSVLLAARQTWADTTRTF